MAIYVSADIDTDPSQLVSDALTQLNTLLDGAGLPGWNQADADLLVIFLNTIAQIAADVNTTASTMLDASFRAYGALFGIPFQQGTRAIVTSTWSFTAPAPDDTTYTIDAGLAVIIDNQAFYTAAETDVLTGATSASVPLQASDVGAAFNGLGGIDDGAPDVALLNQLSFVSTVTTDAMTSGGTDAESDADYMDRLVSVLTLQSPKAIVAQDFATLVVSDIAETATGIAVGRATALDGFYPAARTLSIGGTGPTALTCTAGITNTSPAVTISVSPYPLAVPFPGATVTGTGIPSSTTVLASPAPTATAFHLSANATATSAGETLTITEWTNVENCVTVAVTDADGNALTNTEMDALGTYLSANRLVCTDVFVEPPTYTPIYVTAEISVLPNFVGSETAVCAAAQNALINYFSPLAWGNDGATEKPWLNALDGYNMVRYTSLYRVIESVQGVDFVVNSTLFLGLSASPSGTADLTLSGPAPLPTATTSTIVITAIN